MPAATKCLQHLHWDAVLIVLTLHFLSLWEHDLLDPFSQHTTNSPTLYLLIRHLCPTNSPSLPTNSPYLSIITPALPTTSASLPTTSPCLSIITPSLPTVSPSLPTNSPSLPITLPSLPTNSPSLPTTSHSLPTTSPSQQGKHQRTHNSIQSHI